MIEIIAIDSSEPIWEQSNNNYVGKLQDLEKQWFKLLPAHPIHKSLFEVGANIYITNIDTDFILDIKISSMVQFNSNSIPPTIHDLYAAFVKAREKWNEIILKKSFGKDILIDRHAPPVPIENIKLLLLETIEKAYPLN